MVSHQLHAKTELSGPDNEGQTTRPTAHRPIGKEEYEEQNSFLKQVASGTAVIDEAFLPAETGETKDN